jgi:hypothetical protein
MNSSVIKQILSEDPFTKSFFEGVYSIDNLPSKINKDKYAVVINSDVESGKGLHWVCVYCTPTKLIYFDSLGPTLLASPHFAKFLLKHSENKTIIYSNQALQHVLATTCGFYVIIFILFLCKNYSLNFFESLFNVADPLNNDNTICSLINARYPELLGNSNCGIGYEI